MSYQKPANHQGAISYKLLRLSLALVVLSVLTFGFLCSFSASTSPQKLLVIGTLDDYPIMYTNEEGIPKGLAVDVIQGFAAKNNYQLTFELYPASKVESVFATHGDIMYASGNLDQLNLPEDSLPFYYKNYVLFTTNASLNPNLSRSQLAEYLQKLSVTGSQIAFKGHVEDEINFKQKLDDLPYKPYPLYSELLEGLKSGEITHALIPSELGNMMLRSEHMRQVKEIPMTLFIEESTFRIRDRDTKLLYKLNHYLIDIKKNNDLNEMTFRWFTPTEGKSKIPNILLYFNFIGIGAIIIVLALAYKNTIMKRIIDQKTAEIVRQVRVNEQLYQSLLKEAEYKNTYFINLSHELRTPISLVLNASQMAELNAKNFNDDSKTKLHKYLAIIASNSYRLLRSITHLIDINRIESSEFKIKPQTIDLVTTIDLMVQELINEDYLDLEWITINTEDTEIYLDADPFELSRIVIGLIAFSLRSNPQNTRILLNITQSDDSVFIHYEDTTHIDSESFESCLSSPYMQDSELHGRFDGQGMGLYLVKQLLSLHSAHLTAVSHSDRCEFDIQFPRGVLQEVYQDYPKVQYDLKQLIKMELSDLKIKPALIQNEALKKSAQGR